MSKKYLVTGEKEMMFDDPKDAEQYRDRNGGNVRTLITCDCGEMVLCLSNTNTCDCGADYNLFGQRLASREQWGEETGEHWTECY